MLEFSIKNVRNSQRPRERNLPILFHFVTIPAAWPLTALLASSGIGPNSATVSRLVISATGIILFSLPNFPAHAAGLFLIIFGLVLDNVDGQLARVLDSASHFGKFFDGLVDSFFEVLMPFSLGLYFLIQEDRIDLFLAGSIASISLALLQIVMIRSASITGKIDAGNTRQATPHPRLTAWLQSPWVAKTRHIIEYDMPLLIWDFRYAGLITGFVTGQEKHYLFALCLVQAAHLLCFSVLRTISCYVKFDIYRQSISASGIIRTDKEDK